MEHQQLYATEQAQHLISSEEAYSYLDQHLTEAITTKYLQNVMNKLNICVSDLPTKPIIPRPMNKFIIFRGILGPIIMRLEPLLNNRQISQIIGEMWKNRSFYAEALSTILAGYAHQSHTKYFPGYKYRPRKKQARANLIEPKCPPFILRSNVPALLKDNEQDIV